MYFGRNRWFIFIIAGVLSGCTYNGRVPRNVYHPIPLENRVDASVLVISDQNIPARLSITDPNDVSLYNFTLEIADGTAVAVTDGLSTLFARADAGVHTLENRYDFAADVELISELTRQDCTAKVGSLALRQNGLCTQLTLTLRRAGEPTELARFSVKRWDVFEKPGLASVTRFINKYTLFLLSPLLVPAYTQLQGTQLKHRFETQLNEMLAEIIPQLTAQREKFE